MFPCDKGGQCDFVEEYYGWRCSKCELFFAFGSAPWEEPWEERFESIFE